MGRKRGGRVPTTAAYTRLCEDQDTASADDSPPGTRLEVLGASGGSCGGTSDDFEEASYSGGSPPRRRQRRRSSDQGAARTPGAVVPRDALLGFDDPVFAPGGRLKRWRNRLGRKRSNGGQSRGAIEDGEDGEGGEGGGSGSQAGAAGDGGGRAGAAGVSETKAAVLRWGSTVAFLLFGTMSFVLMRLAQVPGKDGKLRYGAPCCRSLLLLLLLLCLVVPYCYALLCLVVSCCACRWYRVS